MPKLTPELGIRLDVIFSESETFDDMVIQVKKEVAKAIKDSNLALLERVESEVVNCDLEHVYDDFVEEKLKETQLKQLSKLKQQLENE